MTLGDAKKIIDAALAKASAMGVRVSIAVVSEEGHIVCISRMDGAGFLTPEIALGKAFTAAASKRSTADIQKTAESRATFFAGVSTLAHGRFLAGMGGLPILKGQQITGAVGVSGAKPEEDEEIAQDSIKAV